MMNLSEALRISATTLLLLTMVSLVSEVVLPLTTCMLFQSPVEDTDICQILEEICKEAFVKTLVTC